MVRDQSRNILFEIGKLYAVDSTGAYTDKLEYKIKKEEKYTIISISISKDYLDSPDRVYPVLIDPSPQVHGTNYTYDTFASSKNATTNYYLKEYLLTGRSSSYYIRRSYISFDIPQNIYKNNTVNSATLKIKKKSGVAPTSVKARRITSSWSSSTLTWNNKPSTATVGRVFSLDSGDWYKADVTNIVSMWVSGEKPNRGFELRDETESGTDHWTSLYSSDALAANNPILVINYTPYYGSRPYQKASGNGSNCWGYAIEYKEFLDPYIENSEMQGMTTAQMLSFISTRMQSVMNNRIQSQNYSSISSYASEINTGWFRVIMRVGFIDKNGNGVYDSNERYDFHWWYQTNENGGQWAQKQGGGASSRVTGSAGVNPTTLTSKWTVQTTSGTLEYNSNGKYYQIKDIRTISW